MAPLFISGVCWFLSVLSRSCLAQDKLEQALKKVVRNGLVQPLPESLRMLHAKQKPSVAPSVMKDYLQEWLMSEDGKKYQTMRTQLWRKQPVAVE